jgi:hypothetical protein
MWKSRHAGRAAVDGSAGQARVGRAVGRARVREQASVPDRAPTNVLRIDREIAPPVFVDPSGARRRWLRRAGYAVGTLALLIVLAVWLSQLGAPVLPEPVTSCPTAQPAEASCSR